MFSSVIHAYLESMPCLPMNNLVYVRSLTELLSGNTTCRDVVVIWGRMKRLRKISTLVVCWNNLAKLCAFLSLKKSGKLNLLPFLMKFWAGFLPWELLGTSLEWKLGVAFLFIPIERLWKIYSIPSFSVDKIWNKNKCFKYFE